MNKIGFVMGVVLWVAIVTSFTVMLGLEATNETANAFLNPPQVGGDAVRALPTIFRFIGALMALFTFSLPIPTIINTLVVAPMVAGMVIVIADIVKHLIPFT